MYNSEIILCHLQVPWNSIILIIIGSSIHVLCLCIESNKLSLVNKASDFIPFTIAFSINIHKAGVYTYEWAQ